MASTFTDLLRFEKQNPGENEDTWGDNVNTVFEMVEDAIAGMAFISTTGGTTTLSTNNSVTDESRMAILKISGALVSNATIVIPSSSRIYWVWNNTTGSFTVTVKTAAGTGVEITQGVKTAIVCDGTTCYAPIFAAASGATIDGLTVTTALTVLCNLVMSGKAVVFAGTDVAAHATTMNIWATNYAGITGAATTITNFAAAPQAGAEVELYCNAAHTFTHSANMIIQGGATLTVEAGDRIRVRASSTTTFILEWIPYAPFATNAQAQTGTNTIKSVTPAALRATAFALGQTYSDMTASRASGVTYTNSTGKSIAVSMWALTGGTTNMACVCFVSGVEIQRNSLYSNGSGYTAHAHFVVPAGATYSIAIQNATLNKWYELR